MTGIDNLIMLRGWQRDKMSPLEQQAVSAELLDVKAELTALRADSARLEWLIEKRYSVWSRDDNREKTEWYCGKGCARTQPCDTPRQAIDKLMEKEPTNEPDTD